MTVVPRPKPAHILHTLLFDHPLIAPVFWGVSFVLGALVLLWASFALIIPSVSGFILPGLLGLSIALSYGVYRRWYPYHDQHQQGWRPSLQRTWLGLGSLIAGLLSLLLASWNWGLGLSVFAILIGYCWRYFPRQRRQNPLTALAELLNSQTRIQAPGIHYVERVCLTLCIFWVLLGGTALLDRGILWSYQRYPVKILGKRLHQGGRGGPTYSTLLVGWPQSQARLNQRISLSQYEKLTPGKPYLLFTRRSLLGTERVRDFKSYSPPPVPVESAGQK